VLLVPAVNRAKLNFEQGQDINRRTKPAGSVENDPSLHLTANFAVTNIGAL
jgi:hypothetical protein